MSNLRLIDETTATAGVTTIRVEDVFSADFDTYKITFTTDGNSTTAFDCDARLINASGTSIATANYDRAFLNQLALSAYSETRATNTNQFNALFGTADQEPEYASGVIYVYNPFSSSSYTYVTQQSFQRHSSLGFARAYIGVLKLLTSCTGIEAIATSSAFNSDTQIRTYGLRVD